jgi:nucleotide-binding universal stress UspA family protein
MFNAILWPVDGSPLSFTPLQKVIDLARMSGATVVVLSIAEPRLFRASDADAIASGREAEAANLDAARRQVDKVRAAVQQAGVTCDDAVALAALPSAEIVHTARQRGCDLIVMATRGKLGMIDTVLSPSCTQEVIAASPVPVLVFP